MFHCISKPASCLNFKEVFNRWPLNVIKNICRKHPYLQYVSRLFLYTIDLHPICCACIVDQLSVFNSNL